MQNFIGSNQIKFVLDFDELEWIFKKINYDIYVHYSLLYGGL